MRTRLSDAVNAVENAIVCLLRSALASATHRLGVCLPAGFSWLKPASYGLRRFGFYFPYPNEALSHSPAQRAGFACNPRLVA